MFQNVTLFFCDSTPFEGAFGTNVTFVTLDSPPLQLFRFGYGVFIPLFRFGYGVFYPFSRVGYGSYATQACP